MTNEERIARLENVAYFLSKAVTDTDSAWGAWADPMRAFVKAIDQEIEDGREIPKPSHTKYPGYPYD